MNHEVTSKAAILAICRRIVSEEGLTALSMRRIAQECGVALGSLYHYFPSRDELISAAVESVWQDIFHLGQPLPDRSLTRYAAWLYACVKAGAQAYPSFSLAHSVSFASSAKEEARKAMRRCLGQLQTGFLAALRNDPKVRKDAFSKSFTLEAFTELIFSSFLMSLIRQSPDERTLEEVIRRSVY